MKPFESNKAWNMSNDHFYVVVIMLSAGEEVEKR